MYVCMYVCKYVCMHTYICTYTYAQAKQADRDIRTHLPQNRLCNKTCGPATLRIHQLLCVHMYIHTHICVYTYMYIYIYI